MLIKDVLFLPVTLALTAHGSEHFIHTVALLFFSVVASLGSSVWDVDLPYNSLLDIRCVGLNTSGRRLFTMAAVHAGCRSQYGLFLILAVTSGVWTSIWIPFGSSTTWAEVLRVGASVGALVAATLGPVATFATWSVVAMLALATSCGSWVLRKRQLEATGVPSAMRYCAEMQKRLCLWGDTAPAKLCADADVRNTARSILEFEERIPIERLDLAFFGERQAWRISLADAPDYDAVLAHLERLKTAIDEPVTRILMQQVLARTPVTKTKKIGLYLAGAITKFAAPTIDVEVPSPLKGWEFGDLDLAALRLHAWREAIKILQCLDTVAGPTMFGRRYFVS